MTDTQKSLIPLSQLKIRVNEVWSREDTNFTPWLEKHIDSLGDALGMVLRAKQREAAVGDFYLDLLAEDGEGRVVAIENQFNPTNHTHLGQLLTYAADCGDGGADVLIWVTEDVRDEHRKAMDWLNSKTVSGTEFYLVRMETFQLDDSRQAYQFLPVVKPDKKQKEVHQQAVFEETACEKYFNFFIGDLTEKKFPFNVRQHRRTTHYRFFSCGIPNHPNWVYGHEIVDGEASVYMTPWWSKKSFAQKIHTELMSRKKDIEAKWGENLTEDKDWEPYYIGVRRPCKFPDSEALLTETRKWAVEQMFKLAEAIPPAMLQEIAAKLDAEESEE